MSAADVTRARRAAAPAALTATLGLAAVSWVVAIRQMSGMDMGVQTRLGSFAFFVVAWMAMMAAMILPSAAPAVLRSARAGGRVRGVPVFLGSYLVPPPPQFPDSPQPCETDVFGDHQPAQLFQRQRGEKQ
jgi:predicted metal-binding membrane protein